ncbi:tubulin polyglutamylase TTLL5-like isoform X1 [Xyrauchen texanus]|uniref:tubulin polyglutamylase TTLL5-like isoform X1 n=1 Tax=Xyrauchen texanus TaxID=154827 RepID=UPI00224238DA|nr:tubulin polyglutamylase TTLL5-like isoform X1 [Xyrauchen texanus]
MDSTGAISTPEAPRPVQPTDVNTSSISRAPVHTFNQRLSHPCSAGQVSQKTSLSKSRPGSAGVLKEKDSLTAQTQSNQQAIVSALRKLVEKQAARQYSTSSHISLLTQHLTNLNVANGLFSRGGLVLGPEPRPGPVRAVHADTSTGSSGGKAVCEPESVCAGDSASVQSIQQKKPSTAGSYQLQFAIQQLQQQRLQSRQLLNHSRTRHQSFRFLGTIISQDLKWELNISALIKKAQQRMYFLRQLKKFNLPKSMMVHFYTAIIESILTSSINIWYAATTAKDKGRLQLVIRSAEKVIGCNLPPLQDLYDSRTLKRAGKIVADLSHPGHNLFESL